MVQCLLDANLSPPSKTPLFNEQALANTVYAYDKTLLADPELLAHIFAAAVRRMRRNGYPGIGGFKCQVGSPPAPLGACRPPPLPLSCLRPPLTALCSQQKRRLPADPATLLAHHLRRSWARCCALRWTTPSRASRCCTTSWRTWTACPRAGRLRSPPWTCRSSTPGAARWSLASCQRRRWQPRRRGCRSRCRTCSRRTRCSRRARRPCPRPCPRPCLRPRPQ
jgi:hypothetical protein